MLTFAFKGSTMTFQEIKTPEQLMQYLDQHFEYGVIDNDGKKYCDSNSDEFQIVCNTQWKLRTVEKMLKDCIGHCYDQVEVEREWFTQNGFQVKTFWISAYQENIENSGFSHTYLIYEDGNSWKLFEHSDYYNKGIHTFSSIEEAVKWQAKNQIKFAEKCVKLTAHFTTYIKEFNKPPVNITMQEYLQIIDKSKDYELSS